MTDIHALSGAYAIDAVDELERARFERHLAECAACREEVASLREAAAQLPEAARTTVPTELRSRVLDQIAQVRPLPPITDRRDRLSLPERARRRRTSRFLAAAAAFVVIGGGTTVVAEHPWSTPSQADQVLRAGDAISRTVDLRAGGSVTITRSSAHDRAVVVTHDISAPPSGKTYELWLQDAAGTMHPAGLMQGGSRTVVLKGDASRFTGAGITVEPAHGSERPTTAPIALVGFGKA